MKTRSIRLLLVMEQCHPQGPSAARMAWHWFDHLQKLAQVTLVTHARNRDGLPPKSAGAEIHYLEESSLIRRYRSTVSRFAAVGEGGLLDYPAFDEFDRQVNERFAGEVRGGKFSAVMAMTPLLARYPYRIAKACENTPLILGPVQGGLPFPKGFPEPVLVQLARKWAPLLPGLRATYERADRVLCASQATRIWLRDTLQLPEEKLVCLPECGVGKSSFERPADAPKVKYNTLRVLFAGRLGSHEGADMLIDAFAMARARVRKHLHLTIAGEGPRKAALVQQVSSYGLMKAVQFVDSQSAPFHAADLFCLPSLRENGGGAVLEAMAAGLPCVVADHGGIAEFVTPESGVKIPPRSRESLVDQLANAIEFFSNRPDMLRKMAEFARARAEEFSWEEKAEQLLGIINETIEERHPSLHLAA